MMLWKEKTKKMEGGAVAEATAVTVHELARRIGVGAPARRVERISPTKGHRARQLADRLLLWGRMVVFVLIVAASLQTVCNVVFKYLILRG